MGSLYEKAKTHIVVKEPFFAVLLLHMREAFVETLPDGRELWLAATDGTTLFVNPERFGALSAAEAVGVIKHELMHVALLHPWRMGPRNALRWNVAADMVINPMILDEGGELPDGALDGSAYTGRSVEEVYDLLPDGVETDIDLIGAASDGIAEEEAKQIVQQAVQAGIAAGNISRHISGLVEVAHRGAVDWREVLRQFMTSHRKDDYSFSRPNRRFVAGGVRVPAAHAVSSVETLAVILDVSGSVPDGAISVFTREVLEASMASRPSRLVVVYCDSCVRHVDEFDSPHEAEVEGSFVRHGCGGTDMTAGLDHVAELQDVHAAIVFTDGETPYGDEHDYAYPVLWAVTGQRVAPWGVTVRVGTGNV